MILGIDPAQRNVGLCFRASGAQPPVFAQIRTESDILSSVKEIRLQLSELLSEHQPTVFAIEKQMPNATLTGPLLFYVQMAVLEVIDGYLEGKNPQIVWPLPIQLKSYLKKVEGIDPSKKSTIVDHFKTSMNYQQRISSHCVEAFYLTELARKVLEGTWGYKLSESELKITPWKVLDGR